MCVCVCGGKEMCGGVCVCIYAGKKVWCVCGWGGVCGRGRYCLSGVCAGGRCSMWSRVRQVEPTRCV